MNNTIIFDLLSFIVPPLIVHCIDFFVRRFKNEKSNVIISFKDILQYGDIVLALKEKNIKKDIELLKTVSDEIEKQLYKNNLILEKSETIEKKLDKIYSSISEELIEKKLVNDKIAIYSIFFFIVSFFIIMYFFNINIDNLVISILFFLMVIVTAHYILTLYRYTNGFYGMNYDEARELLHFIQKDNDINGPTSKAIFDEKEIISPVTNIFVENL